MSNKFMTVIYDVSQPEMKEKAKKLLADTDWTAAGWSHAFADRDEARAALYSLQESIAAPAAQGDAWLEKCEALIDIWDDGNKPEDERAYFSGAFPEMLEEIRAAIAAKAVNP